jgi:hypothetical protein
MGTGLDQVVEARVRVYSVQVQVVLADIVPSATPLRFDLLGVIRRSHRHPFAGNKKPPAGAGGLTGERGSALAVR